MSDVVKPATIMCAFLDSFDHGQVIMKIALMLQSFSEKGQQAGVSIHPRYRLLPSSYSIKYKSTERNQPAQN